MSDTKTAGKSGKAAPAEEPYEAEAFARKFGLPIGESKTIIKRYGPSKKKLDSYMATRGA